MPNASTRSWKVEVSFCPFESEAQRDRAYRIWAKLFVESQSRSLSDKAASGPSQTMGSPEQPRRPRRQGCETLAPVTAKTDLVS